MLSYSERMRRRVALTRAMRSFFERREFVEVDTPVALTAPAPEPYLVAPPVALHGLTETGHRFLQTSPELPMKRLLSHHFSRIFQLAPAFRVGDESPLHRPEFRILEWYRRDTEWTALLDDCEELLQACAEAVGAEPTIGSRPIPLDRPFARMTMDEAFVKHAGFSILENLDRDSLSERLDEAGLYQAKDDSWNDLFHRIFLDRVEPAVTADARPLFLTHYPAPLGSLARQCPRDPRVSERFELYLGAVELANGFGELTDGTEQRERFVRDEAFRRRIGEPPYPLDERFLRALDTLDSAAGIAMGFDRLVLLFVEAHDLDATSFLPWSET